METCLRGARRATEPTPKGRKPPRTRKTIWRSSARPAACCAAARTTAARRSCGLPPTPVVPRQCRLKRAAVCWRLARAPEEGDADEEAGALPAVRPGRLPRLVVVVGRREVGQGLGQARQGAVRRGDRGRNGKVTAGS